MTRAALNEIRRAAMWFEPTPDGLDPLLQSIGDARLVLIGEASHGTHEFYQIRADLTKALIARHGFNVVAVEADWPDSFGASTRAPTLLIVGGDDQPVIEMNRDAMRRMSAPVELEIIPGATHLFEEPGTLEQVMELAADWFDRHFEGA